MKVIVAKNAGFCYGVKRAVDGAKQLLQETNEEVYCLGELVHNQEVVHQLEQKELKYIEHIQETHGKTMIRAHGASKEVYDYAKKNQIPIVDYSCPNVVKIHEIVEEYKNKGFFIFLIGNPKHPEIIATRSFCGMNHVVIEKEEDVKEAIKYFQSTSLTKILIVSQTTYSVQFFERCVEMIKDSIASKVHLEVKNTICPTTEIRQKETEELSKTVDSMIVIGGKNSSNTKKLYEICQQNCMNTYWIEKGDELSNCFKSTDVIGIVAGASTPQESIDEVVQSIKNTNSDSMK